MKKCNLKAISGVPALLVLSACSGVGSEGDLGPVHSEEVDRVSLMLSANEDCDTVSANRTTTSSPGNWLTGNSYGTTGCGAAYLVDANGYIGKDEESNPQFEHVFEYGDTLATSRAECEKLRLGVYAWRQRPGGGTEFVDSQWRWGSWSGGCTVPAVFPVDDFDLAYPDNSGGIRIWDNYRFAMSARRHATAGASNSSYVLKKIRSRQVDF
jgi:hypothetical protein